MYTKLELKLSLLLYRFLFTDIHWYSGNFDVSQDNMGLSIVVTRDMMRKLSIHKHLEVVVWCGGVIELCVFSAVWCWNDLISRMSITNWLYLSSAFYSTCFACFLNSYVCDCDFGSLPLSIHKIVYMRLLGIMPLFSTFTEKTNVRRSCPE